MNDLYILAHMGLGDAILCNAIVREEAKKRDVIRIPVYQHNAKSVRFMFKDLRNVEIIGVKDEAQAILTCHDKNCLRLGYYAKDDFKPEIFDQEFYRQAKVPFENRWNEFRLPVNGVAGNWNTPDFAFVHDDQSRGFIIDPMKITIPIRRPFMCDNMFAHIDTLNHAAEVHCINSSFLILADSLAERPGQELFFHKYARPTPHPTLKRKWNIL